LVATVLNEGCFEDPPWGGKDKGAPANGIEKKSVAQGERLARVVEDLAEIHRRFLLEVRVREEGC